MKPLEHLRIHVESDEGDWDRVEVSAIEGREAISELFWLDLDVVCHRDQGLPSGAAPGSKVSVVFRLEDEEIRRIHGVLSTIEDRLEPTSDRWTYRLRLVPRASRMTLVETQDVYLDTSVPEIIQHKLTAHGFTSGDFEMRLLKEYPAREFVVQYRESDLAFVSRLAEHLGISFFFEHGGDGDKIVFTDYPGGFRALPGAAELTFRPRGEAGDVFALAVRTASVSSTYVVQDYNYRKPLLDLTAYHTLPSGSGGGIVEYGAHVKTPEEAQALAQVRAEEGLSRQRVYSGKSNNPSLTVGHRSTLLEHPRFEEPTPLLFTEVHHKATLPVFGQADGATSYVATFMAVPGEIPFRPARKTPRARILGLCTGIVQPGPSGELGGLARLDSHGRYTVELHFDTTQAGEQKASHPVRMAQPYVGPNQGMHFPLRPGAEVLLAFVDGDPDRPIIVGALPNPSTPSPVDVTNADRSRITTPSGVMFEIRDQK